MSTSATPEQIPVDPTTGATPSDASALIAPAKKSNVRRNVLIASGAVGLVGIGSTLAANITLNAGSNVEFGQGVARTTACDQDGFTINPVTSYDNSRSIFRLDRVEISGLNLTPVGTGYSQGGFGSIEDAKAAHPGEYYDSGTSSWKRTCDGVVLDFKAYTDDTNYWTATREGYSSGTTNDISTPIGWAQWNGNTNPRSDNIVNFGFSVIFDTDDDNGGEVTNWATGEDTVSGYAEPGLTNWASLDHTTPANSTFTFGAFSSYNYRPNAASISKITVSSMKTFPANYNVADSGGIGRS